jgi:hypothetical protein
MRPIKRNTAAVFLAAAAALAVTVFIWRAKAQTVINAGYDQFSTPANATSQDTLTLPAGAIKNAAGSPSNAFSGTVTFEGGPAVTGYSGDTVIERVDSVTVPSPTPTTPLSVVGINLVSVGTIPITFSDNSSANYSVSVSQSPSTASTGSMTFSSGGTFTNTLSINVEYTFTATGEPTAYYDAAPNGMPSIPFSSSGTWQATGSGGEDVVREGKADLASSSSSSGGVIITPNTEQAAWASHGIGPVPKKTVIPFQPGQFQDK